MPFNEMGFSPDLIMVRLSMQYLNMLSYEMTVLTDLLCLESPWISLAYDSR
jgi:hypothetical protein